MDVAGADLQHYAATTPHPAAVTAATAASAVSSAAAVVASGSLYSAHLQQPAGLTCIARPDLRPLHLTAATNATTQQQQQQQHRQRVFSTAN
ncbi:hypothetical protein CBL_05403 [Carabus blaptoides fortunei]